MVGVDETSVLSTIRTVVPIRAVQTLVADTTNVVVAPVADSIVADIAAGVQASHDRSVKDSAPNCRGKAVLRVMAMLVLSEAGLAKIEILANFAVQEFLLREFLNTAIARTSQKHWRREWGELVCAGRSYSVDETNGNGQGELLLSTSAQWAARGLGQRRMARLGRQVSSAVSDLAVLNGSLDKPVLIVVAGDALIDAVLAKIKIPVIAGGAMKVSIGNRSVAAVAADSKRSSETTGEGGTRRSLSVFGCCGLRQNWLALLGSGLLLLLLYLTAQVIKGETIGSL